MKSPRGPSDDDAADAELDFGLLPALTARQLRTAQLRAFKDFSLSVGGASLGPGSFEILELLDHNPGIGPSRLAAAIGLEKSTMVPAIARLQELALVASRQSAVDRRANELRITPKGRAALAELRRYVVARDAWITERLSADEVDTLHRLLGRIAC